MHSSFKRIGLLALSMAGVLASAALASSVNAQATETPRVDDGVDRARALINEWSGDGSVLEQAKRELDAVLQRTPDLASAHREYARYYIAHGYVRNNLNTPESLVAAERAIDKAIELQPQYAEAFVLRGHLYTLMDRRQDAKTALVRAESLGTSDPWLHLNWAELLFDEGQHEDAAAHCRKVADGPSQIPKVRGATDDCWIRYYRAVDKPDKVDEHFRRKFAYAPDRAWNHGNYSQFLLCDRDDYQAAALQARKALELMDYGIGRSALAAALYRQWAAKRDAGETAGTQALLVEARALVPNYPLSVVHQTCGTGKTLAAVLSTMQRSGDFAALTPADAIELAADAGPKGTPGVFQLTVRASGRDASDIFLNSEVDYRDQRNVTVHFIPAAITAFQARYGQAPDQALKGKTITVGGLARRERIDFRTNGVPTGKFYYQTHVWVADPEQVVVLD